MDETPPEEPTARHRGPNKGGNVQCEIESTVTFPQNEQPSSLRCSPSGLSTQGRTPTKRLIRKGSLGTQLAVTEPSYSTQTPPGDAQNITYVQIGQMNTFLGVGTACKFDSGA